MRIPFELFIGFRYLLSSKRNGFVSFISFVSVAGIALGVAALIVILSVMNGFQKEVRDRMLTVVSHIEISAVDGDTIDDWETVFYQAKKDPEVLAGAPYVDAQAMLNSDGNTRGVLVRGIDPQIEPEVADFAKNMHSGHLSDLRPGTFRVAIGKEMADQLLLGVGSRFTLISSNGVATPAGLVPRIRQVTVGAIFQSGHYNYDSSLVLMSIQDAARLFRVKGVNGVRLKIADMFEAPQVAHRLSRLMGHRFSVRSWPEENRNWFAAVKLEKRMMFIILMLIVTVATFNLVSMLVMSVTEKQADIAILRTLGASPSGILRIFMIQGASLGALGTAMGLLFGLPLSIYIGPASKAIESFFGFELLPQGIYFINYLPSEMHYSDVFLVSGLSFLFSWLATFYPSWRAARTAPAQALRYE